ncbi:hypothetical protein [Actinomadura litoris]|uniref:hypothetical protein n=1 Tax=Actinomadura litoris TaxID=2678616 RepID=UPI001FA737EB|nr:hypothetical protein [Actinomadura litoris]
MSGTVPGQTTEGRAGLSTHFRLLAPPEPGMWERLGPLLRGVWAVLVLLATALDALVTAFVGTAPLTPRMRRVGQVLGDEFRAGQAGAVDAEVIEDDVRDDRTSGRRSA